PPEPRCNGELKSGARIGKDRRGSCSVGVRRWNSGLMPLTRTETAERIDWKMVVSAKTKARFIEPMLLQPTASLPDGTNWMHQLKLDGYRALGIKTDGKVHLRSRNNKDFNSRYPGIARALGTLLDETVIDGELV